MAKRKARKLAGPKKSRSLNDEMEDILAEIDREYPPGRKSKPKRNAKARKSRALDATVTAARAMANPRASARRIADAKRREINLTEDDPEMRALMLEAVNDFEQRESTARQKKKPSSRSGKAK